MVARKPRSLKPGTEYDRLITPSLGGYLVRLNDADTDDTLKLIQEVIRKTLPQTAKLAQKLKGATVMATCRNIWNWVYEHIQYKEDRPGHEEIRHPSRIWADRKTGVDCDDYTVMISSILANLRIPHKLRMTSYGKGWQHIYVVVPIDGNAKAALNQKTDRHKYIAMDDVTDAFNHEVTYAKNRDIPMTLNELNGLPVGNTGEVGNIFKKIGKAVKSVGQGVKKAATTPVRLGILAAMKLNFPKGADKLRFGYVQPYGPIAAKAGYGPEAHKTITNSLKKLIKTFVGLGGDHKVLFTTILNGKGNADGAVPKNLPNPEAQDGFHGIDDFSSDPDWLALKQVTRSGSRINGVAGLEGLSGSGLGELGIAVEATVAAASAVLIPILKLLVPAKANDAADPVPDEYLPEEEVAADETATDETVQGFLGAVAKKKAAAKRVQTVADRQVAKGKPVPPKAKAVVKKAAKVAPRKATVVKPLAPKPIVSTTSMPTMKLPSTLPGVTATSSPIVKPPLPKKTQKAIKKANKKPNFLQRGADSIKKLVTKKPTTSPGSSLTQKKDGRYDPRVNRVVTKDTPITDEELQIIAQQSEGGAKVADPQEKVDAATSILVKTQNAIDKGVMTVEQGRKIYDKVVDATKRVKGQNLPVPASTPVPAVVDSEPDAEAFDAHEVVDSAVSDSSTKQAGMGTLIGVGVGALLLGGLLFGGKSSAPRANYAPTRRRVLNGPPNRKKSRKKASKRGLGSLSRVDLPD